MRSDQGRGQRTAGGAGGVGEAVGDIAPRARYASMSRATVICLGAKRIGAALLLALVSGIAAAAPAVEGVVRHVTDGDSLVLQTDVPGARSIKLRLLGLDAPEICQAGGVEARDALARRVAGRRVIAIGSVTDDYRRRLVTLVLDGEDIGAWMVREGHAWNTRFRGRKGRYAQEERDARDARRGVFELPEPMLPHDFRLQHGPCF